MFLIGFSFPTNHLYQTKNRGLTGISSSLARISKQNVQMKPKSNVQEQKTESRIRRVDKINDNNKVKIQFYFVYCIPFEILRRNTKKKKYKCLPILPIMQLFPQTTRKQNPKIPAESRSSTDLTHPK